MPASIFPRRVAHGKRAAADRPAPIATPKRSAVRRRPQPPGRLRRPSTNLYAVYVWSPNVAITRSVDAHFYVDHADGTTPVTITQARDGNNWRFIGQYPFYAGQAAHVRLSNASATNGAYVFADAIRVGGGVGDVSLNGAPVSGKPRWEEQASQYAKWVNEPDAGLISDVWIPAALRRMGKRTRRRCGLHLMAYQRCQRLHDRARHGDLSLSDAVYRRQRHLAKRHPHFVAQRDSNRLGSIVARSRPVAARSGRSRPAHAPCPAC